jgi:hypothetical protein
MRGVIPPLPQYAFMAWCSVKKSTGIQCVQYCGMPSTLKFYRSPPFFDKYRNFVITLLDFNCLNSMG